MTQNITNYFRLEHLIGFIIIILIFIFSSFFKDNEEDNIEIELPSYSEHLGFNIGDHISKIQNDNYDIKIVKNKSKEYNSYKLIENKYKKHINSSHYEYFIISHDKKIILISKHQYFDSKKICKIYLDIQKAFLETIYDISFEKKYNNFFFERERRITINNCEFNKKTNKHSFSVKFN